MDLIREEILVCCEPRRPKNGSLRFRRGQVNLKVVGRGGTQSLKHRLKHFWVFNDHDPHPV
jgi:hypothetical protein